MNYISGYSIWFYIYINLSSIFQLSISFDFCTIQFHFLNGMNVYKYLIFYIKRNTQINIILKYMNVLSTIIALANEYK